MPIRMAYIGSFASIEDLYIREVVSWISSLNGKAILDVFSYNIPLEILEYLNKYGKQFVKVYPPLKYFDINNTLKNYDVGFILYKPTAKNIIYCAPNKLFEYIACGLDVLYPKELIGCNEYAYSLKWPKVLGLDFNNLTQYDIFDLVNRTNTPSRNVDYSCEESSTVLINELIN